MFRKRIVVREQERALLFRDGRFHEILPPGEHHLLAASDESLSIERHTIREPVFRSQWSEYLLSKEPETVARYFTQIATSETQIAMIYIDGALFTVLVPAKSMLFWRGAALVTAEVVDLAAAPDPEQQASSLWSS